MYVIGIDPFSSQSARYYVLTAIINKNFWLSVKDMMGNSDDAKWPKEDIARGMEATELPRSRALHC